MISLVMVSSWVARALTARRCGTTSAGPHWGRDARSTTSAKSDAYHWLMVASRAQAANPAPSLERGRADTSGEPDMAFSRDRVAGSRRTEEEDLPGLVRLERPAQDMADVVGGAVGGIECACAVDELT